MTFPDLGKGVDVTLSEEVADDGARDSGAAGGRRLIGQAAYKTMHRHRLTVSFMALADRITLAQFYLSTTVGAVRVWEWTHPKTEQTWLLRFDPDQPPVWSRERRQPDRHHAELTVVEDITDGYVRGVYAS